MRFVKSWLIATMSLVLMLPVSAWSQALPSPQPERVNRALSGALQESMRARGFAANDPRFANTLARISPHLVGVAGGTAAAITAGAVTAPAWASVALAAGIGAVVTYGVTLAVETLVKWLFRDDTIEVDRGNSSAGLPGLVAGQGYWQYNNFIFGGDGKGVARAAYDHLASLSPSPVNAPDCYSLNAASVMCIELNPATGIGKRAVASFVGSGSPYSCPTGQFYKSGTGCQAYQSADGGVKVSDVVEAISDFPTQDLDKQLNPVLVAGMVNAAWQAAASQPGYDGLPYPQSNPISATEVARWARDNPEFWPSVQDFVRPNPSTPTNPNPWALPANPTASNPAPVSPPNTGTTNPAQDRPLVNLGPDPGIGSPDLEAIPTAQQIASPILELAPDLRGFQARGQSGVCPKPTIQLYGAHVMDAHCKLIEDNKQVLQLAMAFAWAAMALFIVLSA